MSLLVSESPDKAPVRPEPTRSIRTFDSDGAAAYLGVSAATVKTWARTGALKGFRDRLHQGGPWRFNQADLDECRRARQQPNI